MSAESVLCRMQLVDSRLPEGSNYLVSNTDPNITIFVTSDLLS